MTISSTSRRGRFRDKEGDEDYAKTTDECLHVELTKQHLVACGAEKPRHNSALCNKKNPLPQLAKPSPTLTPLWLAPFSLSGVCVHPRCFECGAKCCFCVPCNRMVMASGYKNRKKYVDYAPPGATPLWQTQSCPYIPAFIDLSVPVPYSLIVFLPFPTKLIACPGGYHPEDMEEHEKYITDDMKQRQVHHRAVPEGYAIIQPGVIAAANPVIDDLGQQLRLIPVLLANRADHVVKAFLAKKRPSATSTKGAAKSMAGKDPQGTQDTHVVAIKCTQQRR